MSGVPDYLSIGDFSRATHLTVKTLRHYHQVGLLEPADIDPQTGYRRYATGQIPAAQVIRRFRDLGMPLEQIQAVLAAPDLAARNQQITAHLSRLEDELGRTQSAVSSLRDLLAAPRDAPARIELRTVPAVTAAAITGVVDAEESAAWLQGALGELRAVLTARDVPARGPAGGIYADEVFTRHRGQATIFVPCAGPVRPTGRVDHHAGPGRRAGGHRVPRGTGRGGPRLRHPGHLRGPARPRGGRPDPRVLPGRPARHRRRQSVANRDRLAHLPDQPSLTTTVSPIVRPRHREVPNVWSWATGR